MLLILDTTIMDALGGILDWSTEQLSFKTSQVTIKACHRRVDFTAHPDNTATTQCSVVSANTAVEPVRVLLRDTPQSERAVKVEPVEAPPGTTAALIETPIVAFKDCA